MLTDREVQSIIARVKGRVADIEGRPDAGPALEAAEPLEDGDRVVGERIDQGAQRRQVAVHRGRIEVAYEGGQDSMALSGHAAELGITIGDWILIEPEGPSAKQRLERQSLFQRRAAGTAGERQLIAANVDPLESDLEKIAQDVLDRWQDSTVLHYAHQELSCHCT